MELLLTVGQVVEEDRLMARVEEAAVVVEVEEEYR